MRHNQTTAAKKEVTVSLPLNSPELKVDKNSQIYYSDWKLEDQIIEELKGLIEGRLEQENASEESRMRIRFKLAARLSAPAPAPSLVPDVAPALYKERPDKSQSAEAFTLHHYSKYFGQGGLTRADLKRLDLPLYRMLMKGGFPPSLADDIPPAQGKGGGGRKPKMTLSQEEREERLREQRRSASRRYKERHGL